MKLRIFQMRVWLLPILLRGGQVFPRCLLAPQGLLRCALQNSWSLQLLMVQYTGVCAASTR
jgi:hypothetical protein